MKREQVWLRAVMLAVWGGTANLWVQRHYGVGIDDPISLLGMTGGPVVALAILDRLLDEEELTGLKMFLEARVRTLLRRTVLATPVLVLLYVGGIAVAATYSSVTVVAPQQGSELSVEIAKLGGGDVEVMQTLSAGSEPIRLRLATNPFGRDVRLSMDGFVAKTVRVYPWTGVTVDPERDLSRLPTLLFRPSVDSLASLADGGALKIFKVTDRGCRLLGELAGLEGGALTLGPARLVPPSYTAIWHLELQAEGLDPTNAARVLLAWSRPKASETSEDTEPGARLYAVVASQAGKRKAQIAVTAGNEEFQDIRVDMSPAATATCTEGQ